MNFGLYLWAGVFILGLAAFARIKWLEWKSAKKDLDIANTVLKQKLNQDIAVKDVMQRLNNKHKEEDLSKRNHFEKDRF